MYVLGTGWYCAADYGFIQQHAYDPYQRDPKFFYLWYNQVNKYLRPEKIIIVNACSPVPVPGVDDRRIQYVDAVRNFGLWKDSTGPFCGCMNAILMCAAYALVNQCDLIYVEQDTLVRGYGLFETALMNMRKGCISYGKQEAGFDNQGLPVEHSLIVVPFRFLAEFIYRYNRLSEHLSDKDGTTEWKFHQAYGDVVDYLPFGCGRNRPIDWTAAHLYVQHFRGAELHTFLTKEGLRLL